GREADRVALRPDPRPVGVGGDEVAALLGGEGLVPLREHRARALHARRGLQPLDRPPLRVHDLHAVRPELLGAGPGGVVAAAEQRAAGGEEGEGEQREVHHRTGWGLRGPHSDCATIRSGPLTFSTWQGPDENTNSASATSPSPTARKRRRSPSALNS